MKVLLYVSTFLLLGGNGKDRGAVNTELYHQHWHLQRGALRQVVQRQLKRGQRLLSTDVHLYISIPLLLGGYGKDGGTVYPELHHQHWHLWRGAFRQAAQGKLSFRGTKGYHKRMFSSMYLLPLLLGGYGKDGWAVSPDLYHQHWHPRGAFRQVVQGQLKGWQRLL